MTSPSDPSPALEARLAALESTNRELAGRLRRRRALGLAAWLAVPLLAWTSQRSPGSFDEVTASAFKLVDDQGRVRAALEFDPRGEPRLQLNDTKGGPRVRIRVRNQEAFVNLFDEEGHTRLGLAIGESSDPHVMLLDRTERPRYQLTTNAEGAPGMMFVGADGTICRGLGIDAKGEAWTIDTPLRAVGDGAAEGADAADADATGGDSRKK